MKTTPHDRLGVRVSVEHGKTIRRIAEVRGFTLTYIMEHAIDLAAREANLPEIPTEYLVELAPGLWISDGQARKTTIKKSARRFLTRADGYRALSNARSKSAAAKFSAAKVIEADG